MNNTRDLKEMAEEVQVGFFQIILMIGEKMRTIFLLKRIKSAEG